MSLYLNLSLKKSAGTSAFCYSCERDLKQELEPKLFFLNKEGQNLSAETKTCAYCKAELILDLNLPENKERQARVEVSNSRQTEIKF